MIAGSKVRVSNGCGAASIGARTLNRVSCDQCPFSCKAGEASGIIVSAYGALFGIPVYRVKFVSSYYLNIREDYLTVVKPRIEKTVEEYDKC